MLETNVNNNLEQKVVPRGELARKLDALGWSLFFIWVGIALLVDIGWSAGLLGVGIITLGMQAVRKFFNLKLEGFWVVIGLLFIVGGIWEFYEIELSLIPILFIVAGVALLFSIFRRSGRKE